MYSDPRTGTMYGCFRTAENFLQDLIGQCCATAAHYLKATTSVPSFIYNTSNSGIFFKNKLYLVAVMLITF